MATTTAEPIGAPSSLALQEEILDGLEGAPVGADAMAYIARDDKLFVDTIKTKITKLEAELAGMKAEYIPVITLLSEKMPNSPVLKELRENLENGQKAIDKQQNTLVSLEKVRKNAKFLVPFLKEAGEFTVSDVTHIRKAMHIGDIPDRLADAKLMLEKAKERIKYYNYLDLIVKALNMPSDVKDEIFYIDRHNEGGHQWLTLRMATRVLGGADTKQGDEAAEVSEKDASEKDE